MLIEFIEDDQGYIAWLADHSEGYVLNCGRPPQPSYLKLHKATCPRINGASGRRWTFAYQKVCGDSFGEADDWARQIGTHRVAAPASPVDGGRFWETAAVGHRQARSPR